MEKTDVVIIGAGPVGIFAAFEAGMLGIKSHIIDILEIAGGQCSSLYPEKPIYDIPAYPQITGADLINNLLKQIEPFKVPFHLSQHVTNLEVVAESFLIKTSKNLVIQARAVVIAAGSGAFVHKKPPLENIESYEGKSIFYTIQNSQIFNQKIVAIAGGGDSAADWAILLSNIAKKVYLIHRRDNLRCLPESANKIDQLITQGKIEKLTPYQLGAIKGQNGMMEKIILYDMNNNPKEIKADYLLPFFGLSAELGPIYDWGFDIEKKNISVNFANMQTSLKGVYAIGDVAYYPHKLKLILTGFAEAATAMHDIYNIIFPDKPLHFEYSTTKGIVK